MYICTVHTTYKVFYLCLSSQKLCNILEFAFFLPIMYDMCMEAANDTNFRELCFPKMVPDASELRTKTMYSQPPIWQSWLSEKLFTCTTMYCTMYRST